MARNHYDRIVVGLGGIGSYALLSLARQGVRVLGLEQFQGAHDRGSSHGQTRIIRQAYFEHPDYVPLLQQAYQLWDQFERETGLPLFARVGLLEIGPPEGPLIVGVKQSAHLYNLPLDHLTSDEARRRYPGFVVPEGMAAVFEQNAGVLFVERCIEAAQSRASELGAVIHWNEICRSLEISEQGVQIETDAGRYSADGLVLCLGAWAPTRLPIDLPLRVVRKHLHWFASEDARLSADQGCPAFFYEMPAGYFYGFPAFDALGVKVAEHSGGELVTDPSRVDRGLDLHDLDRVQGFVKQAMPMLDRRATRHAVCMYTMTPDEQFLVDRHAEYPSVVYAAGLSGHGFKFAPALGAALATMSLESRTPEEVAFLSARRFSAG